MEKKLLTIALLSQCLWAGAEIRLPDIISDGMVVQQKSGARLWGQASPGATIEASASWNPKAKAKAKADANGLWQLTLSTPTAGYTPYHIDITGDDSKIRINDVLAGEVWLCSGQSNMEMPLRGFPSQPIEGAAEAIATAGKYPMIRVAKIPKTISYEARDNVPTRWVKSNPKDAPDFSALAYFYARGLHDLLDVPVGIIDCSYGGSKLEGWSRPERIASYPDFDMEREKNDPKIQDWERVGVMYQGMLRPVERYTVAGYLWNQGESNVGRHATYGTHMADMVSDWRKVQGRDVPFYLVEIPGWDYGDPDGTDAAKLREAMHEAAAAIPNAGIACTTDLTYPYELNIIHARRKQPIAERLLRLAAGRHYGIEGMDNPYPTFREMRQRKDGVTLFFDNAWDGFDRHSLEAGGFEVAGTDGKFVPAKAINEVGEKEIVLLRPEGVDSILYVRYNYKNFPEGKVVNNMGMPLLPFHTDGKRLVSVDKDGNFSLNGKPYNYMGTNLWYGVILASEGRGGDLARLRRELDTLKSRGIDNVRVLVGGDGSETEPSHISPVLQSAPGVYNDTLLHGLDRLLVELEQRDMRAVLYLNNAWEWSGGYGTYLEWAGEGPTPNPAIAGYDKYMSHVALFVHNKKARELAASHVRTIVSRVNSINGRPYSESPSIMSWQIANEPRAFASDPASKEAFASWIAETAALIKSLDKNHLVSTGSEGKHGCEQDIDLWERIHLDPNVDYGVLHLWPYNWGWVSHETPEKDVKQACEKALEYITPHSERMARAKKPLVLEEFGFPRDGMATAVGSPTTGRDAFYEYVESLIGVGKPLSGANFWGWGGEAQPVNNTWRPGDPYTGDPAQEPQGLNSVFSSDRTLRND